MGKRKQPQLFSDRAWAVRVYSSKDKAVARYWIEQTRKQLAAVIPPPAVKK